MVAGDGRIEGVDLFIKAFPKPCVGVAHNDRNLTHRSVSFQMCRQRTGQWRPSAGDVISPRQALRAGGFRAA
jgi:hypothetical protein